MYIDRCIFIDEDFYYMQKAHPIQKFQVVGLLRSKL